ncbi:transcriptional regulator [Skermanella stibiiresistens SB22]|uniref:Transcriptional regulator n=1 Tax=Skermanella stibiiresistens SB22 TaxID=1385369 RepID=W9GZW8_9PROT|nr:response regulator [Skermanella stibiiresistens]EWY39359.1 transcriptional regulator [Skermanella stibiiresistens SB22]
MAPRLTAGLREARVGAEFNRTVFLVDDDEPVRDSLRTLLESYSMAVEDYSSCPEFLENFRTEEGGCLVLDLHLPVMSGLEFMEIHGGSLDDMPVILITGRGDPATKARALEAGVLAFIEKPFEDESLVDLIRTALCRPTRH